MMLFAKTMCLAMYALMLASLAGYLPGDVGKAMQWGTAVFLVAHVLELAIAFKYVRRHPGSLAASIALTMLFGVLHWRRYMREPAQA